MIIAPSKPSMTQQELVGRRLGQSNGKVRAAAEVVTLVQQLSMMLAVRLQRLSTNFLNEAGSVLQTIMDPASKQFAIELLLPWVQRVALLESGVARRVPRHVGIIMDGNGRWAEERGLKRQDGHTRGLAAATEIIHASHRLGLEALTLFAFSSQSLPPRKTISVMAWGAHRKGSMFASLPPL